MSRSKVAPTKQRPVFFNPLQIQMPVGALTSIAHRISGILLALAIPLALYAFSLSLQSPQGYAQVATLLGNAYCKTAGILITWALAHHLLAGTRHLLSDIDIGSRLPAARRSAWLVNIGALIVALVTTVAWR